jgi:hypothetical protein
MAVIVIMATMILGCGKKGDPVFAGTKRPMPLGEMKAQKSAGAIILEWRSSDQGQGVSFFRVEKNSRDPQGTDCPGCPQTFETVAEIPVGDPACRGDVAGQCRYTDYRVIKGMSYMYRLLSCNREEQCDIILESEEIKY